MPEWVIVGDWNGVPVVLSDWVLTRPVWTDVADVKAGRGSVVTFRDRWRAKSCWRRVGRRAGARCVRKDRL